jgi:hypothetical protein
MNAVAPTPITKSKNTAIAPQIKSIAGDETVGELAWLAHV